MFGQHFSWLCLICAILGSLRLAEGYQIETTGPLGTCPEGHEYVNGLCFTINRCPDEYYLKSDGLCYRKEPLPCPFESTTEEVITTTTEEPATTTEEPTTTTTTEEPTTTTTTEEPSTTTTTEEPTTTTTTEEPTTTTTTEEPTTTTTTEEPTTTTTTEETTTTTTEEPTTTTTTEEPTTTTTTEEPIPEPLPVVPPIVDPPPDEQVRCPPGSIFFNEQCRKIVCTEGEYYAGRCLSPACPTGTVWHGKRCQPPGYITTILEIDNVIHNSHEYTVVTENVNKIEHNILAPSQTETLPPSPITETTTRGGSWYLPPISTTEPTITTSSTTEAYPDSVPPSGCCLVKSPRICRNYAPNWVCSSRDLKLCDPKVCTRPIIYLKPPHIVESDDPPFLIMPPNPPQLVCSTPECKEGDMLNCSGCKYNRRETCSAGCYNYFCPAGICEFMNSEEFCALYPGGFGCNKRDGCIWNWCTEKCH